MTLPQGGQRTWGNLAIRLRGGDDVLSANDRGAAHEWEIAQGVDDFSNKFSYLRNKRLGHIVELNHERCGGFRFAPAGGQKPRWTFACGDIAPDDTRMSHWRCPCVPDAFEAATGGGDRGPSTERFEFDPRESISRWCTPEEIAEGFTAGNITVWPGSRTAMVLEEQIRHEGLILRDDPKMPDIDEGFVDVEDPLEVDPRDNDLDVEMTRADSRPKIHNGGWQVPVLARVLVCICVRECVFAYCEAILFWRSVYRPFSDETRNPQPLTPDQGGPGVDQHQTPRQP